MRKGVFLFLVFLVGCSSVGDTPLTNEQVLKKASYCDKKGMSIQMVYDDQWEVYAVKCIERYKLPNGKEKK